MTKMNIKRILGHPEDGTLSAKKLRKPISVQTGIYKYCLALQYIIPWFILCLLQSFLLDKLLSLILEYCKVSQITFNMLIYINRMYPHTSNAAFLASSVLLLDT